MGVPKSGTPGLGNTSQLFVFIWGFGVYPRGPVWVVRISYPFFVMSLHHTDGANMEEDHNDQNPALAERQLADDAVLPNDIEFKAQNPAPPQVDCLIEHLPPNHVNLFCLEHPWQGMGGLIRWCHRYNEFIAGIQIPDTPMERIPERILDIKTGFKKPRGFNWQASPPVVV